MFFLHWSRGYHMEFGSIHSECLWDTFPVYFWVCIASFFMQHVMLVFKSLVSSASILFTWDCVCYLSTEFVCRADFVSFLLEFGDFRLCSFEPMLFVLLIYLAANVFFGVHWPLRHMDRRSTRSCHKVHIRAFSQYTFCWKLTYASSDAFIQWSSMCCQSVNLLATLDMCIVNPVFFLQGFS